jgi:hypothetical protein
MPTYYANIRGKRYGVESDEPMTQQDVDSEVLQQLAESQMERAGRESSRMSTLRAGGLGVQKVGQGVGQLIGKIPGIDGSRFDPSPSETDILALRQEQEIAESGSPTGKAASIIGEALPSMATLALPGGVLGLTGKAVSYLPRAARASKIGRGVEALAPKVSDKWSAMAIKSGLEGGLQGTAQGAVMPVVGDESRGKNAALAGGTGAVAGLAPPIVGRAGRAIWERVSPSGMEQRAARTTYESIADDLPSIDARLKNKGGIPKSVAAQSGSDDLAKLEYESRKARPESWRQFDETTAGEAQHRISQATGLRSDIPQAKQAASDAWTQMGDTLRGNDPFRAVNDLDDAITGYLSKVGDPKKTAVARQMLERLRSKTPMTTDALMDMRQALAGDPDMTLMRGMVDDALDSLNPGAWKNFMGPQGTAGQAQQRIKEAQNLDDIYNDLRGASAPRSADVAPVKSSQLVRSMAKRGTDEYGPAMPPRSRQQLEGIADEMDMIERAKTTKPDLSEDEKWWVSAARSASPFRLRPLAAEAARASQSDPGRNVMADMLRNPDTFMAQMQAAQGRAARDRFSTNAAVQLLRSLGVPQTVEEKY